MTKITKLPIRLFDNISLDYMGPASFLETEFNFLNRSAREEIGKIRGVLEGWFSHYPIEYQKDLRARFRSDNHQHWSAFWELLLHQLLLELGCKVIIHPRIDSGTATKPDFLAESGKGCRFYLEAVIATDESDVEAGRKARMSAVYDALNKLESPDFFIGMELKGYPAAQPSGKQMRHFLQAKLKTVDYDKMVDVYSRKGVDSLPRWRYEHSGWVIDFFPIPKKPEARGKIGARPLGLWSPEVTLADDAAPLRDAILKKAGKYGKLDQPFVIAVNTLSSSTDQQDILDALFGKKLDILNRTDAGTYSWSAKWLPDGVWLGGSGPQHTSVSAVLVGKSILPTGFLNANMCLYHNPWAPNPYNCSLTCLAQALPKSEGRMEFKSGIEIYQIMGHSLE